MPDGASMYNKYTIYGTGTTGIRYMYVYQIREHVCVPVVRVVYISYV